MSQNIFVNKLYVQVRSIITVPVYQCQNNNSTHSYMDLNCAVNKLSTPIT